jgi:hypothetical protein
VEKYPDLALSALTKLIAKDWNELSVDVKKVLMYDYTAIFVKGIA